VKISRAEKNVLLCVSSFIESHGYAPTIREIQHKLGMSSFSPIQVHLKNLKAKGYLTYIENMSRTIRLNRMEVE
jgi:repressor LexA